MNAFPNLSTNPDTISVMNEVPTTFLSLRRVGLLTPGMQVAIVALLYVVTTLVGYLEYQSKGTMFGYPLSISILFVPIYEEIIFRGLILKEVESRMKWPMAITITSVLFGLWHLKNIFFLSPGHLAYQIAYTGLIVSPILSYITLKTRTVWPAVILHYLNNLLAPLSWMLLELLMH